MLVRNGSPRLAHRREASSNQHTSPDTSVPEPRDVGRGEKLCRQSTFALRPRLQQDRGILEPTDPECTLPVLLLDRATVLLLGVAAGSAIGFSFVERPGPAASIGTMPPPALPPGRRPSPCPSSGSCSRPGATATRYGIAVFGDSCRRRRRLGLQQQLSAQGQLTRSSSSPSRRTGFTRYRRLDLEAPGAREQLGADPLDIAVALVRRQRRAGDNHRRGRIRAADERQMARARSARGSTASSL